MHQVQLLLPEIKRSPVCKRWEIYLSTKADVVNLDGPISSSFVYSDKQLHYMAHALYAKEVGVSRQIIFRKLLSDKIDRIINIQVLLGIFVLDTLLLCQSIWGLVSHDGNGDQRAPELNPSWVKNASVLVHLGKDGQHITGLLKTDLLTCVPENKVLFDQKGWGWSHTVLLSFSNHICLLHHL